MITQVKLHHKSMLDDSEFYFREAFRLKWLDFATPFLLKTFKRLREIYMSFVVYWMEFLDLFILLKKFYLKS